MTPDELAQWRRDIATWEAEDADPAALAEAMLPLDAADRRAVLEYVGDELRPEVRRALLRVVAVGGLFV